MEPRPEAAWGRTRAHEPAATELGDIGAARDLILSREGIRYDFMVYSSNRSSDRPCNLDRRVCDLSSLCVTINT